jgi:adenine phosphoribosyltransferase
MAVDEGGLGAQIEALIRDIPDFPKPGVTFKDITPLLDDHATFAAVVGALAAAGRDAAGAVVVDKVVGMEARGFILAAPVALALGVGFVPVRKPGKLPWHTRAVSYELEYGAETLEMHTDALAPGERVLVIDDVLATGGTAHATAELVEQADAVVHGLAVLLELSFLPGREAVGEIPLTVLYTV